MIPSAERAPATANRRLLGKLLVVACGMFGFGFALVPLYKTICEVTGIRDIARPDTVSKAALRRDAARVVTIEFDANSHNMPWSFRPVQRRLEVHPGEVAVVEYEIRNTGDRAVTGQAVPSFSPQPAAQYVKKLECFCFRQQTLGPHEMRALPVAFVIDPGLPAEVGGITLSYTFFEVPGRTAPEPRHDAVNRATEG